MVVQSKQQIKIFKYRRFEETPSNLPLTISKHSPFDPIRWDLTQVQISSLNQIFLSIITLKIVKETLVDKFQSEKKRFLIRNFQSL